MSRYVIACILGMTVSAISIVVAIPTDTLAENSRDRRGELYVGGFGGYTFGDSIT